jgi:hypothetical protein
MRSLIRLRLAGTKVGDEGLTDLCQLPNLESLSLEGTEVSGKGAILLGKLPKLKSVMLCGSRVGPRDVPITLPGNGALVGDWMDLGGK